VENRTARQRRVRVLAGALAGGVVATDWATKALAAVTLDDRVVEVGSVLTLRLGHNPGVAFGLGNRLPGAVLIILTAVVTAVVAVSAARGAFGPPVAAGLVLGGAVGNLGDRVVGGTVVDFLDLGWWPSFNVADIAITGGVAWVLLAALRAPADPPPSGSPLHDGGGEHHREGDDVEDDRLESTAPRRRGAGLSTPGLRPPSRAMGSRPAPVGTHRARPQRLAPPATSTLPVLWTDPRPGLVQEPPASG